MVGPSQLRCDAIRASLASHGSRGQLELSAAVRNHVDHCQDCWAEVVRLRWELSQGSRSLAELEQFLGDKFESGLDSSWRLAKEWNESPRQTRQEVEEFYRRTPWYAYNLVLWEASGQRRQYVTEARDILEEWGTESVLDLGAGVGTDAVQFLEMGLDTTACEYSNESSRFMAWRATQRALPIQIISPDDPALEGVGADLVWAMDVIEHLPDPGSVLSKVLRNATLFVYDTEHSGTSGGRQPFHYQHRFEDIARIVDGHGLSPIPYWWDRCKLHVFARAKVQRGDAEHALGRTAS
jgi:SAM-dependent methyltransferase